MTDKEIEEYLLKEGTKALSKESAKDLLSPLTDAWIQFSMFEINIAKRYVVAHHLEKIVRDVFKQDVLDTFKEYSKIEVVNKGSKST